MTDIPTHDSRQGQWKAMQLKHVTRFAYGDSLAAEIRTEGNVAVFGSNGPVGTHRSANTRGPCIVVGRKGSFGKVSFSEQPVFAIDTTYYIDSTQTKHNLRWLYHLLSCLGLDTISQDTGVPGLSREDAYSRVAEVPSASEQQAIAAFLDRKTAQIDQIIAKKQRLIELLHEKRQALISQAVTKGLDPSSRSTPINWAVERLKFRMKKIEQGWSPQCENRQAEVGEWGVLKVGCMNSGVYDESENKALPFTEKPEPELEVHVGDILMSRSNTIELVGSVGMVHKTQGRILLCDKLYRLVFDLTKLVPEYVVHLLRSHFARCQIERDASGASPSMKNISNDRVADLALPFPPIDEQHRILTWLHRQLAQIARISSLQESQLEKLREFRQTLITDAVTGKIEVQGSKAISLHATKANPFFRRSVLAAEIVDRLHTDETFGRVKFQKALFLCEHHLNLPEVGGDYRRAAAGPFDNRLIHSVESQLERSKWYKAVKSEGRTTYVPMEKAGGHKPYFSRYWGEFEIRFTALVKLLKPMKTEQAEIVATLYAAWNDFLIKHEPVDDQKIVNEVLSNWDDSKARISEDRWHKALDWMRQKGLTPHGFGRATEHTE
jgi:restriction endonuclease S subunit